MGKVLPSLFAVIVGVVLGATVALLWVNPLDYRWVDATGTWFGGIATVLTLLWAVHVFRKDQDHREEERVLRHLESLSAERRQEHEAAMQAAEVVFKLRGGGGYGSGGDTKMDSIHIHVSNTSDRAVSVVDVKLDEPLKFPGPLPLPTHLPPHDSKKITHPLVPVSGIPKTQFSGKPLTIYGALFVYSINGRTWARRVGEAPYPHVDAD